MPLFRKRILLSVEIQIMGRDHLKENDERTKKVEAEAKDIILKTLPKEMKEIYDISFETRIVAVRYGSIILFFEIFLTAYDLISGYSGIFDSVELIKKQLRRLLHSALNKGSEEYAVKVETEIPFVPEPRDQPFRYWSKPNHRDAFFYYLLVLNIILLIIIGALVYKAVIKTYFP